MRIADRIKGLEGIEDAYWESQRSRLVIYYDKSIDLFLIKLRVSGAIGDACLQRAIDEITLIGC